MSILSGPYTKLGRASEHLANLRGNIQEFFESHPVFFFVERRSDRDYFKRIGFLRTPDVLRWAAIAGDVIGNLRAALDQLVYAIAIAEAREAPPPAAERLMFPIVKDEASFRTASTRMRTLSQDVHTAIEALQPYQTAEGDRASLLLLHDLARTDRHRLLNVGFVCMNAAEFEIRGLAPGAQTTVEASTLPLRHGSVLLRVISAEPIPEIAIEGAARFSVILDHPPDLDGATRSDLLSRLEAMRNETRRVTRS